jgi:predicted nucleic acid-binding protein
LIFLLDTCVLSEATKPQRHAGVMNWIAGNPSERQYISALTLGELHYGVERLASGRKQKAFRAWIGTIVEDYAGRIVPFDEAIAATWGQLRVAEPNMQTVDALIAATALTYGFTLVTRNVKHFAVANLTVVDPWGGPG